MKTPIIYKHIYISHLCTVSNVPMVLDYFSPRFLEFCFEDGVVCLRPILGTTLIEHDVANMQPVLI